MSKTRPFGSNRCPNCGEYGSHFCGPSFGDKGFFCCKEKIMNTFEFFGSLPADEVFEHNLLFNLVEEGGLRDFIECEHSPDRQGFKITIQIERTDNKTDQSNQKAQMPWRGCKKLW